MDSRLKIRSRLLKAVPILIGVGLLYASANILVACGGRGQFDRGTMGSGMMGGGMMGGGMGRYQADSSAIWGNNDGKQRVSITRERAEVIISQYADGLSSDVKIGNINDIGPYYEAELLSKPNGEIIQIIEVNKESGELRINN